MADKKDLRNIFIDCSMSVNEDGMYPPSTRVYSGEDMIGDSSDEDASPGQHTTSVDECAAVADSNNPSELVRVAHQHWARIGWPEDAKPIALLERAIAILDGSTVITNGQGGAISVEDALAATTAELRSLRESVSAVAERLVRLRTITKVHGEDLMHRDTTMLLAEELRHLVGAGPMDKQQA